MPETLKQRAMSGPKAKTSVAHSASTTTHFFGKIANTTSRAAGHASTFIAAIVLIIVWALGGPYFGYSDTWQLVINTGTTIITFLMVFLIQNSQNRDSAAIQVKLDELIRASDSLNTFVGIEHLTEQELEELRAKCEQRAKAEALRTQEKANSPRVQRERIRS
jgi:low affinity Fe/Cu permease